MNDMARDKVAMMISTGIDIVLLRQLVFASYAPSIRGLYTSFSHDQKHLTVAEIIAGVYLCFLVYMSVCMDEYAQTYFVRPLRFAQATQILNEPSTHGRAIQLKHHLGSNGEATE